MNNKSEVPERVEDLLFHTGKKDGDEHDPRGPAGPAGKSNGHGHAAGPAQYASGRRPGTSRGGSSRKLAAPSNNFFYKMFLILLMSLKLVLKTGNGIIPTGNGIISPIS